MSAGWGGWYFPVAPVGTECQPKAAGSDHLPLRPQPAEILHYDRRSAPTGWRMPDFVIPMNIQLFLTALGFLLREQDEPEFGYLGVESREESEI
jgi:hypothetical protein